MSAADDFNWKGEAGDKFSEANPSTAAGMDKEMLGYFQKSGTEIFTKVLGDLKAADEGFSLKEAKIIDVGCSSGGKLAILESLGANPENIYGVDMSPKAIEVLTKNHPAYKVKEINGFKYDVFKMDSFDLVYHSAVFCQIPQENYDDFFKGIKSLKPKYYMFVEGICPSGPNKVPNSVAHGHRHKKHEHPEHGKDNPKTIDVMEEGYHYVDNMEEVIGRMMPEAKQIGRIQIEVQPDMAEMFHAMYMEYFLAAIYKM
jgi:SAM-dependent methyltransferase